MTSNRNRRKEDDKHFEVSTACDFLTATKLLDAKIKTLAEFVGSEREPTTNMLYDKIFPDVVAVSSAKNIGIELTAYSNVDHKNGKEDENALWKSQLQVHEYVIDWNLSHCFLRGFHIFWGPNTRDVLSTNITSDFAEELLDFARAEDKKFAFKIGDERKYPEYRASPDSNPFTAWKLLKRYAKSVTIRRPEGWQQNPVCVYANYVTSSGTSVDSLGKKVEEKIKKFKNKEAYKKNIDEFWLLIHATRNPSGSAIAPLSEFETNRLLNSSVAKQAQQSGFSRVVLWDGIDGGYVDLKTGENCPVQV
ncbi:MAG: hypothetical protein GXP26_04250 [Planctomycetes bacterium]|nr:hypothetical protein [Planctomycetota bacterium]